MYAYSRICQILKRESGYTYLKNDISFGELNEQERAIFNQLIHFDATIGSAADTYSPHKIPQYLFKLAQMFHAYYETTQILSGDKSLLAPRLALLESVRRTIREGLSLMKIEAKEEL